MIFLEFTDRGHRYKDFKFDIIHFINKKGKHILRKKSGIKCPEDEKSGRRKVYESMPTH